MQRGLTTARDIIQHMESLSNETQRQILMGFFKTGPGEYGEGDEFLGIKVPQTRVVVKLSRNLPLSEVTILLQSHWHEVRLCGFLILVDQFEKLSIKRLTNDGEAIRKRDEILKTYLHYAKQANNWDLVDLSAPKILGAWLLLPTHLEEDADFRKSITEDTSFIYKDDRLFKETVLDTLAASPCLWRQRMSIVCTWKTSQQGDPSWCLRYAEKLLYHPHDLMHKAVGWMLREMGKRVSMNLLREFLRLHIHEMHRTTLRYAIEKLDDEERQYWMKK